MAMKTRRGALLAAAVPLVLLLWAAPAEAQPPAPRAAPPAAAGDTAGHAFAQVSAGHADAQADACDPRVAEALAGSAQIGVEADLAIIRHPGQGIRNPDSIFDFSCIWDLFDYRAFDVLFDPAGALDDILDLARRRLCAAARDAYRRYLGRSLDASVYTVPARRLPGLAGPAGLGLDWRRRNAVEDVGTASENGELFRDAVGGSR